LIGSCAWRRSTTCFQSLAGVSASQMIGRSWEDLFPPLSRSVMAERLSRVLSSGEALDFEIMGDGASGRRYAVRAFPYPGGVAVLIQNRTAEYEMQSQIREARALGLALGALSELAVLRVNLRGLLTEVSDSFARLMGLAKEDLLTRNLADLALASEQATLVAALEQVMQSGEPAQLTTRLLAGHGGELAAHLSAAAVIHDLSPQGAVLVARPALL
jgi:PAS domain S-box-containing protein